jgi:hypothetical protein
VPGRLANLEIAKRDLNAHVIKRHNGASKVEPPPDRNFALQRSRLG